LEWREDERLLRLLLKLEALNDHLLEEKVWSRACNGFEELKLNRCITLVKDWMYKNLRCMVVLRRTSIMEWYCGYVAVPSGHPDWGKGYEEVDVEVHGGLTFSGQGKPGSLWEDKQLWWFGFDCAHAEDNFYRDDYLSARPELEPIVRGARKWKVEEVVEETEKLAEQLYARWKSK